MSFIGNILWLVLGGVLLFVMYFVAGLLLCCTIIGIPFGVQLMKVAFLAACPFGRDVDMLSDSGCLSVGFNVIWVLLGWWEIAIVHFVLAFLCAITIIGIPFAKAHLRLMKLSFMPFGSNVSRL